MTLAGPVLFFHLQALPAVLVYAAVFFALGAAVGWLLWHERREEADRIREQIPKRRSRK